MVVSSYQQWVPGSKRQVRLPIAERAWHGKEEGSRRRRFTQEQADARLARLRSRFSIGEDGYLRDADRELGRGESGGGVGAAAGRERRRDESIPSVPCMLWMYCDEKLKEELRVHGSGGDLKPPDPVESAFLLDHVLVQDATWEFTHASATDGSRKWVEGVWEVGRGAVMHNGTQVSMVGGAMRDVEDNFAHHSYEAELEAMTDTAAAVSTDAQQALGGGGRWMNITDSLSGAQASQSYHSRSDSSRTACYRFDRLSGLEIAQSGLEACVQIWVHSHGKAGGFSVNEVADLLATAYRVSGEVDPGVRPPAVHVCAILPEVKHSHCKWMLDAHA